MSAHAQRSRGRDRRPARSGDLDRATEPRRAPPARGRRGEQGPGRAATFGRALAERAAGALPDVPVASIKDLGVVDFDAFKPHTADLGLATTATAELDLVGSLKIRPRDPLAIRLMAEQHLDIQAHAKTVLDESKAAISVQNVRGLIDGSDQPRVTLMGAGIGGAVSLVAKPTAGPGGVGLTLSYAAPKAHADIGLGESFHAVGEVGWTIKITIREKHPPEGGEAPSQATSSQPSPSLEVPAAAVLGLALGGLLILGAAAMAGPAGAAAVAVPVLAAGLTTSNSPTPTSEPGDV